jgi:hypothetical protein
MHIFTGSQFSPTDPVTMRASRRILHGQFATCWKWKAHRKIVESLLKAGPD